MPDKTQIPSWRNTGTLLCLGILVAVLLSAGCTALFPATQNTGPGTGVLPGNETRPVPENCTFDHEMENLEIRQPGLDSCYFGTHSPMEYLNDLRLHPDRPVLVLAVPDGWITPRDAELLMQVIDSHGTCSPGGIAHKLLLAGEPDLDNRERSPLPSGRIPGRALSPVSLLPALFQAQQDGSQNMVGHVREAGLPDERDAIRIVQETWPDLRDYSPGHLTLKTIGTQKAPDGWYVAFIQEGSGVPIISARCYHVSNDRTVRQTGLLNHSIMVQSGDFSPVTCG